MKKFFLGLFIIGFTGFSYAQSTIKKQPITLDQVWGSNLFFEKQPLSIVQSIDNTHYYILESDYSEINKYQFKPSISKTATLVTAKELNLDYIHDFVLSPDEKKILIVANSVNLYRHSYVSDLFFFDVASKNTIEIAPQLSGKRDFSFSPDGSYIVFSHQNNLYHHHLTTNKTTAITTNGKHNEIINGTGDWVYEEEFSQTKYYDISFDGRYIAYISFEQFDVPPVVLSFYKNEIYPDYEILKYPKVGEKNSIVRLHIFDKLKNKSSIVSLGEYEYLPRLHFSNQKNYLIVQSMNRKQDYLRFHKITCTNGKYSSKILSEEKHDKYIEIEDKLLFLPNEDAFITLSDRDGYKHIYKFDSQGKTTLLTPGKYDVLDIAGITKENTILYTAAPLETPYNSIIQTVDLNGKQVKTITELPKKYGISSFQSGCDYFYGFYTEANEPKTIAFFGINGTILSTQETNQKLKTELGAYDISPKTFTKIKGATDSLFTSIIYPTNFDKTKKYPVYMYIYGGPGANTVQNRYGGPEYMYHQLLAQNGYFVISVDPRGTLYRGADFKKQTYGKLGELELEDFIAVAKEVATWDFIDKDRIGIQGWSYGGYMSSLAITKGADIFKMAIAVAPVSNWKFYDNVYTERYMNLLENNKDGYETTSPMNYAKLMKGKFLLIHGDTDDNVHVQNAMELARVLIQHDKEFDYFVYPNKNHSILGVRKHLFRKMLNFTLSNL